jgi:2-aminoadipate transaminase
MSGYMPRYLPVDLTEDGPDLGQVEESFWSGNPKFIYSIPNFQNPTGVCYDQKHREGIASLLKKFDMLMLEDDPYNEIRFEGNDLPPIISLAPNNVIWTGSFSKMVAPGLRMGWAVLPKGLAPHFVKAKQSTDLHSNNLSQYVLHHFFTHNNIDEHLVKTRAAYKEQCDAMKDMIRQHFPPEIVSTSPKGGMFLWLTLPKEINSEELIVACLKKGVAFVPGRSFFTTGEGYNNIRLNFSNSCLTSIEKGIEIMAEEIDKVLIKNHYLV